MRCLWALVAVVALATTQALVNPTALRSTRAPAGLRQHAGWRAPAAGVGAQGQPVSAQPVAHRELLQTRRQAESGNASSLAPVTPGYGPHLSIKGYALNLIGLLYIVASFGAAFLFYPFLLLAWAFSKVAQPKTMRAVDWVVHWWSKSACLLMTYAPRIRGMENLPPKGEAVMYIPNHCSYFDIMTLSGFLPRPFKYISKVEVLRIPMIGWAMQMAHHIAIRRSDRKSQLQTFKDAVAALKDGNSLVTFAEGTRSKDGRLRSFKKGPFTMAKRAGVRIVPVSLVNTHVMMPRDCLMPVGVPRNVEIRLHPAISTEDKTEEELLHLTREAIAGGLPEWQAPPTGEPESSA